MRTLPSGRTFFLLALSLVSWPTDLMGQSLSEPLRILLTNDDGYQAPGITAMHDALVSAGFAVTLVAPTENQSSSSARVTSGVLPYAEASPGVWHVGGSPADAVLVALNHIMRDAAPDLVVSGTNFGQNIGSGTSHSGTVGAAVTAARRGVSAIAVSAAILPEEGREGTIAAFAPAAGFVVRLITQLQDRPTDDGRLLPERLVLNVNYPGLVGRPVEGVRIVPVSDESSLVRGYTETGTPGEIRAGLSAAPLAELPPETDVWFLTRGYVTINVINANTDAGPSERETIETRLPLVDQE